MWDKESLLNVSWASDSANETSISAKISTTSESLYTDYQTCHFYESVDGSRLPLENKVDGLPKFGDFQENYGWVECESKSMPGKTYFFNVKSGCSTWIRPVASSVQLTRYSVNPKKRIFSSDDDQSVPLMVSDNEGQSMDAYENNHFPDFQLNEECNKNMITALNVAKNVYYCPQAVLSDDEYDIKYFNKLPPKTAKDCFAETCTTESILSSLCYQKDKLLDSFNRFDTKKSKFCKDKDLKEGDSLSSILATDFLEINYSNHEITEFAINPSEDNSSVESSDTDSSTTSPSSTSCLFCSSSSLSTIRSHQDSDTLTYNVPRLKKISSNDLLDKARKDKGLRTPVKKECPPKCKKIVCNMYGTKTINYDPPEPLNDVCHISILSNSSAASSELQSKSAISLMPSEYFEQLRRTIREPVLSESSSDASCGFGLTVTTRFGSLCNSKIIPILTSFSFKN